MQIKNLAGLFVIATAVAAWNPYQDESLSVRDVNSDYDFDFGFALEARGKVKLDIPKKMERGGSVKKQDEQNIQELGEKALKDHNQKSGTVIQSWHSGETTSSRDMKEHFSVRTDGGVIHVYRNGESTIGKDGKGKRDLGFEAELQARHIDMLYESRNNFLQARDTYLALLQSTMDY